MLVTNVVGIVQAALYTLNVSPPTSLITSTPQVLQLKHILYDQSRQLRSTRVWPQQKRTYTFDLVSGQSSYQLPGNYYAALTDTAWDDDRRLRLIGPMSDAAFTDRTKGGRGITSTPSYRIFGPDTNSNSSGGQFHIHPTPTSSGETLSFEYISSDILIPPYWIPSEASITVGTYRNVNSNIYKCTAITTGTTSTTAPTHTSGTAVDGGVTWSCDSPINSYEIIISDFDRSVFDDDLMISGVRWRYLQANKMNYMAYYEGYTALLNSAQARWTGSTIGSMTSKPAPQRYASTPGSWTF
ncbi:hypothetical protein UFOVP1365_22 [uncultured Caudovirales phage]|uniref:Uncharacterized protein n=1 Tax=uncultured Caudovirales phage TaxID=2100421 RepID=A0A6J5S565_9CAUD|nr:hypothetical protein UFOVP1365_22 [uncultured Caudovirales phage]